MIAHSLAAASGAGIEHPHPQALNTSPSFIARGEAVSYLPALLYGILLYF